jgi:hypothetical protein
MLIRSNDRQTEKGERIERKKYRQTKNAFQASENGTKWHLFLGGNGALERLFSERRVHERHGRGEVVGQAHIR